MMFKLFYITFVLLITNCSLFGQTSYATVSATIVTPVGAEISVDNMEAALINKNVGKEYTDADSKGITSGKNISFLKIIGDVFAHNVTIEENYIPSKKVTEDTSPRPKPGSFVGITVNFD